MALTALAAVELGMSLFTLGTEIAKIANAAMEEGREELSQEEQDRIMNLRKKASSDFVAKWKRPPTE